MPSRVGGGALPLRIMPLEAAAADPASLARLLERHRSARLACSCYVRQVCLGVLPEQRPEARLLHGGVSDRCRSGSLAEPLT